MEHLPSMCRALASVFSPATHTHTHMRERERKIKTLEDFVLFNSLMY